MSYNRGKYSQEEKNVINLALNSKLDDNLMQVIQVYFLRENSQLT